MGITRICCWRFDMMLYSSDKGWRRDFDEDNLWASKTTRANIEVRPGFPSVVAARGRRAWKGGSETVKSVVGAMTARRKYGCALVESFYCYRICAVGRPIRVIEYCSEMDEYVG